MEYYTAIKGKRLQIHTIMWMNFKIIINKRRHFLMLQAINLRRTFLGNKEINKYWCSSI